MIKILIYETIAQDFSNRTNMRKNIYIYICICSYLRIILRINTNDRVSGSMSIGWLCFMYMYHFLINSSMTELEKTK